MANVRAKYTIYSKLVSEVQDVDSLGGDVPRPKTGALVIGEYWSASSTDRGLVRRFGAPFVPPLLLMTTCIPG